ncbi:hydroxyethylthiazole kinase [Sphingobacterium sp. PCS056]|uniref:hydroxyethylthiazole kinase n=1 Tax=Sphingobacterium sp. PCS056 TaxID=2931400 RepID=UPI00200CB96C|nr:hydroxyethylthiazole kinase [Sphingobacterium sp. PCS056]UPZ36359.1 hydroxyethylthiazole kinase [Sphingobacterium sp. PCS056]
MEKKLWQHIIQVRNTSPLIHNITNYVVMNNTANALLAVGASPIMAHAKPEVEAMVTLSHALVINIGTLDEYWSESMFMASKKADSIQKPWVLDPVGAGATSYRDTVLNQLLLFKPTVIRGNASEIIALAKTADVVTKGVDSTVISTEAIEAARNLHAKSGAIICISGETDIIISHNTCIYLKNGNAMMTKVTGLGCTASALIAAFIAAVENKTEAVAAAMSLLSIAGELAAKESAGPASLQTHILDKLYNITEHEFLTHLKITQS